MKRSIALLSGLVALSFTVPAHAVDPVEQVIMKCRVNALSVEAQVTCLEDALRARSPVEAAPNWSGVTEDGATPESTGTIARGNSGSRFGGTVTGLGSEQVTAIQESRSGAPSLREQSTIVDFAYNSKGRLIAILSNGQVWKQRDGDLRSVDLEDGDSPTVIVRKGTVSGYRMSFPDLNREITVSRLR